MRWFISDTHFGHNSILALSGRPFKDVEEMDRTMVDLWNAAVDQDDEVFFLGDFCWRKNPSVYLDQLKGKLHLIVGNHDHKQVRNHPRWLSVNHYLELESGLVGHTGRKIVLSHYAFEVWNKCHYGAVHLHGHSHGNLPRRGKRYDVGVDNKDRSWSDHPYFAPKSEDLTLFLANRGDAWLPDHHKPTTQELTRLAATPAPSNAKPL